MQPPGGKNTLTEGDWPEGSVTTAGGKVEFCGLGKIVDRATPELSKPVGWGSFGA